MLPPLSAKGLRAASGKLLFVTPYVGMRYPSLPKGVEYVVFNTYHSGTLDTKSSAAVRFFERAKKRGIKVFAVGVNDGADYESALSFEGLGIIALTNIAPIAAYLKLWLLTSMGEDVDEGILLKSLSGDVIPALRVEK